MTKACIASETWSKAQAEEDDRLTDSAAPSCSCSHLASQPVSCQKTTTTLTASVPDGTTNRKDNNSTPPAQWGRQENELEERRHTRHNTQHRQIDPHSRCYCYQHTRLPPAENSSQRDGEGRWAGKTKATGRRYDSGGGGQRTDGTEAGTGGHPPDGHTKEETLSWWGGELFDE